MGPTGGDLIEKSFIYGAVFLGFVTISLFFFRFWLKSKDRFFAIFGSSFLLLAAEGLLTAILKPDLETRTIIYLLRLTAFILIIGAIIDKNRAGKENS